jgi:hypothetical protein
MREEGISPSITVKSPACARWTTKEIIKRSFMVIILSLG